MLWTVNDLVTLSVFCAPRILFNGRKLKIIRLLDVIQSINRIYQFSNCCFALGCDFIEKETFLLTESLVIALHSEVNVDIKVVMGNYRQLNMILCIIVLVRTLSSCEVMKTTYIGIMIPLMGKLLYACRPWWALWCWEISLF